MPVSRYLQGGYGRKLATRIITVDPATRRIEGTLKDGAMVQIRATEVGAVFRWPAEGEVWTIRRDDGYWILDSRIEIPEDGLGDVSTLNPGDTKITGNTLVAGSLSIEGDLVAASGVLTNLTGLPTAGLVDNAVTTAKLEVAEQLPVGSITDYAGSAAPTGWLLCFGQSVRRDTYAALFAVVSTTYGSVDGDTFNLPDLRGRVVVALDNMGGSDAARLAELANTRGLTSGAERVTLASGESGNAAQAGGVTNNPGGHTHVGMTGVAGAAAANGSFGGHGIYGPGSDVSAHAAGWTTGSSGGHTHTTPGVTGVGASDSHENMPPYMLMNKMIKF